MGELPFRLSDDIQTALSVTSGSDKITKDTKPAAEDKKRVVAYIQGIASALERPTPLAFRPRKTRFGAFVYRGRFYSSETSDLMYARTASERNTAVSTSRMSIW
jgi:hypothetical protein